ncbi:hypothetical protein [Thalassotalea sp. ND16A]|uniref:hypothetical protein n=1 Tax=Thalassotalea sp. ND16A TaxID=1535422 RepID=UPI00051CC11E|nr:hypothetical protein [Thalassotalea sp. ND16A]KGJ98409.1 hypothetical protein ND16A_0718 [Thalassotalea sp. ND16A]
MNEPVIARWALIRDMLVFQVKLAMDAIRDLFLSPVSIICGLVDILKGHSLSQSYFHKLMRFGHKTDSWLNLFGNHNTGAEHINVIDSQKAKADVNVDQLFSQVESLLKEQHGKGGLTASAKATIDRYLNKIVETKTPSDKQR